MFGISSTEFLIILLIALIVIGPQKLPEMIRTVGKLVGKVQRFTKSIKNELTNEFELDEIKKSIEELKQSSELQRLKKELDGTKSDVEKSFKGFESSVSDTKAQVEGEAKKLGSYLDSYEGKGNAPKLSTKRAGDDKIDPEMMDDEASFDIAFDEAFLQAEAEHIEHFEDHNDLDDDILTAPPKGFAKNVTIDAEESEIIRRIVQMRQAEIIAETDPQVAKQFAFLEAKRTRQLLSDDERRRRMTVRQLELNR